MPLISGTGTEPFNGLCVICLCVLCSVGGLILDKTVSDPNFAGMAVFTPVINGESWPQLPEGKERAGEDDLGGFVLVKVPAGKRIQLG